MSEIKGLISGQIRLQIHVSDLENYNATSGSRQIVMLTTFEGRVPSTFSI